MRWIFYSLFFFNVCAFLIAFFLVNPRSEMELIAPEPMNVRGEQMAIVLLKENEGVAVRAMEDKDDESSRHLSEIVGIEAAAGVDEQRCYRVGPFNSAASARTKGESLGVERDFWLIEEVPESIEKSFWVYVPALSSKEQAVDTLRELQSHGIDSFVVSNGADANAISLGTFKRIESADALKARVSSFGFDIEVRQRDTVKKSAWLFYKSNDPNLWSDSPGNQNGSISASIYSCEMFALH